MSENVMFQETIDAIRQGQRGRARDLLTRLLRADQSNPEYWLYMSSVVDSTKEQIYCLQSVLRLDPGNKAAKQGLVLLGALQPDESIVPSAPVVRKWETATAETSERRGLSAIWGHSLVQFLVFGGILAVVAGLVALGVWGFGQRKTPVALVIPTKTEGPPPTFTLTPTFVNAPAAPTVTPGPTQVGPTRAVVQVEEAYTPTPLYVNTPHASSEAYNIAIRAFRSRDWDKALDYMQQAAAAFPEAADIQFQIGEIYRSMGQWSEALKAYDTAIRLDSNFGPAYLGRARARNGAKPGIDISNDLKQAIAKDPNFAEPYLERAAFYLRKNDPKSALKDIATAEKLLPASPLVFLYRGQAQLAQEETEAALESLQRAVELDRNLAPAHLLIAQMALDAGDPETALPALQTYVLLLPDDSNGWTLLGRSLYEIEELSTARDALDKALELGADNVDVYLYSGLTYLALEKSQAAVNDLVQARRFNSRLFAPNLALGRALLLDQRAPQARDQFNSCLNLATSDVERAQVYYWRGQALEATNEKPAAVKDWKALLALPEKAVPEEWRATAQEHIARLATPTPTPTPVPPTATRKPSSTSTRVTPAATATPKSPTSPSGTVTATPRR